MNLSLLIFVPLLTALLILPVKKAAYIRWISLSGAAIQLALAFFLLFQYHAARTDGHSSIMLFEQAYNWLPAWHIQYHTGVDGIAVAMILLTAFVSVAGILVSWNISKMTKEFYLLLILLGLGAYGFFISLDLFLLFFFLEISVIPKYLLIGIWGSGNKTYSANKLALMLMGGSALILVGILALYFYGGSLKSFDMLQLAVTHIPRHIQLFFFPFLFIGFGIFTAIFPFHSWVPDGHSSAPTAGSMFLAGISMKLGGYGCLRVACFLMPAAAVYYSPVIIVLATIGILYGAFATLAQKDLKYMNAYSSVSHCGFVLLGIGILNVTGITGAVFQMVSHGLMTALFFAVIGMIYQRTHTRIIAEMGGLMKTIPFICTVLFIAGFCSLGLPGLSGFVAEITVFAGGWQHPGILYRLATIIACMSIVVTAVYILRAVTKTAMGPLINNSNLYWNDAAWNEKLAAVILVAGILAMGIAPYWLHSLVSPGAEIIMQKITAIK